MVNLIKKSFYTVAGLAFSCQLTLAGGNAASKFGGKAGTLEGNLNTGKDLSLTLQTYINTAMTFLSLIAICMALWGGFQILTAAGADDKVKKGKTILIQAAAGLAVIWIAGTFVNWILGLLTAV